MDGTIAVVTCFAGNFAPRNWAFCNGQIMSIVQNTALFSILGTTYGGDGQTTFALPDLRGRVPVGASAQYPLGTKIGVETVTLSNSNLPSHTHTLSGLPITVTDADGGGQPFENRQPALALTPVIALQGIYPSRDLGENDFLGGIGWFAGQFAPRGYAMANGQLLSIAQNTALFSLLGTTYGGDGRT